MKKSYSRYTTCFLIVLILSAQFLTPTILKASEIKEKPDTLTFIHISDPHVCNLTGYHPFFIQKRQHFGKNAEPLSQFLKSIPAQSKADFVVITGDNIDYYEAETAQGEMLDTQIEQYSRLLDSSEVPVYLTLGNHDIASYYVNSDSTYTNNQFNSGRARATWIRNITCFKNGSYYSRVFNIGKTSYRLIFLDNAYSSTRENSDSLLPFTIDQSQLLWLDSQMKSSKTDVEIIFVHVPIPYKQQVGNSISTEPLGIYSSGARGSLNLLRILENNPSARLILAGHKHINKINNYKFINGNTLTQVMTGGFGYDPNVWRMIKIAENDIIIYFPGSNKIEYIITI
jgi:3',5'-cyclic AMP phosphodiesterase CpdA